MRCKNCGWDNPDQNVQCKKCMVPLEKSDKESVHANNRDVIPVKNTTANRINFNATIHEKKMPFHKSEENELQIKDASFCLSCGYRLRAGDTSCPMCGNDINLATVEGKPIFVDEAENKEVPYGSLTETVNPWMATEMMEQNIPMCTLTLVAEDCPAKQTISTLQYVGSEIVLNRNNTDPANATVSSQEQAALVYENGEWFIEDRSSMKTTFVHAGERKRLKAGDMILMGNRRFIINKL